MSRHLGGFRAWLLQRVSAVYLGLFTLFLFYHFLFEAPNSYQQWQNWIQSLPVMLATLLAILLTLLHAWIGIRDVLIDYVSWTAPRLVLLSLVGLMLSGCAIWALIILI